MDKQIPLFEFTSECKAAYALTQDPSVSQVTRNAASDWLGLLFSCYRVSDDFAYLMEAK